MRDEEARRRAREEDASFLVRAPAGSGKTELLTQRFLRLLATVEQPEALLALTFSRKAAAEMQGRILQRLVQADAGLDDALRAKAAAWGLFDAPSRLRVLTLDALAMGLVARMPWLTRSLGAARPVEAAQPHYRRAARRALADLDAPAAAKLVAHWRGDFDAAAALLADMLGRRDQWLPLVAGADPERLCAAMETELAAAIAPEADQARALLAALGLPDPDWRAAIAALLTAEGKPRKRLPPGVGLDGATARALHRARQLPAPALDADTRAMIEALCGLLPRAAAELRLAFAESGECDFTEITLAAAQALGGPEAPTELAYRLDARLQHLFVDEFQDTSRAQHHLLAALTADWTPGDGRTLFLVGDPMQSIYGWRNAQVGQFLAAGRDRRFGRVPLTPLDLSRNFRSQRDLVAWCNSAFALVSPTRDDLRTTAARFVAAEAEHPPHALAAVIHALPGSNRQVEAEAVVSVVRQAMAEPGSIAVLVPTRTALDHILPELRRQRIAYRGVKLRKLGDVPAVGDLLHLARALLQPADRLAWLAVLRAPWCGLRLADLVALCGDEAEAGATIPERLADPARRERLSADGRARLAAVVPVLLEAAAQARRVPARELVAWCWGSLGGGGEPADTDAFFERLETCDRRGDLAAGYHALADALDHAASDLEGDPQAQVQIMSVHEAKGLEFDTVLVPGLDRAPKAEAAALLRWIEYPGDGGPLGEDRFLLAPPPLRGGESPLYQWLGRELQQRREQEQLRLLYVAATRAKRTLHLFGMIPTKDGGVGAPKARSPLERLWPALQDEFRRQHGRLVEQFAVALAMAPSPPLPAPRRLRRVAAGWRPAGLRAEVRWSGARLGPSPSRLVAPPPDWNAGGQAQRDFGTAVHRALQRLADAADPERAAALIAALPGPVADPVRRTLADPRGRWILGPHSESRTEWRLAGVVEGELRHAIVDRTFIEDGVRWILDYKTAAPDAGPLDAFLDAQWETYRPQLELYARLAGGLDPRPVRLGLYFPLCAGWRESRP